MSDKFLEYANKQLAGIGEIDRSLYQKFSVKRGLRNADGSGVLAGLTQISSVIGFKIVDEEVRPVEGELYYRGIHIDDLVAGIEKEKRHGFTEVIYLLIFGKLPNEKELMEFRDYLNARTNLPSGLNETSILGFPSPSVMNKLQRVILVLYGMDPNPDDISIPNVVTQCLDMIAKIPPSSPILTRPCDTSCMGNPCLFIPLTHHFAVLKISYICYGRIANIPSWRATCWISL